ncbi:unnamed protein product [Calicophoron daubneyi]|uniref:LIM zinc-binding domain-containing protein n=1 Tax=Calicophoron daubneyi TaxID=300641 RepID=A0AAV2TM97_CALDB
MCDILGRDQMPPTGYAAAGDDPGDVDFLIVTESEAETVPEDRPELVCLPSDVCPAQPSMLTVNGCPQNQDGGVRQVVIGSYDRMSMVVEENEDDLIVDYDTLQEPDDLDVLLTQNAVAAEDVDLAQPVAYHEPQMNTAVPSIPTSDVRMVCYSPALRWANTNSRANPGTCTLEDEESAVEGQRPMGERWGETSYATVLRHAVTQSPERRAPTTKGEINGDNKPVIEHVSLACPEQRFEDEFCHACEKPIFSSEMLRIMGQCYHKSCFRCHECRRILSAENYHTDGGIPYCQLHHTDSPILSHNGPINGELKTVGQIDREARENGDHLDDTNSSTAIESHSELPPRRMTLALVAKFQQLEADAKAVKCSTSALEDANPSRPLTELRATFERTVKKQDDESAGTVRKGTRRNLPVRPQSAHVPRCMGAPFTSPSKPTEKKISEKVSVPTPFLQAESLHKQAAWPHVSESSTDATKDLNSAPSRQSSIKVDELPNPGIAKDMIAKFSALSAA